MRALLTLASSSVTGPAERMLGDAEVLRAAGHEVTLAIDTRRPGNLAEACEARGFPIAKELELSRTSRPWASFRDVRALRRRLLAGVDLVHAHFSHDHHLALLAGRGLRELRVVRSLESELTGSDWGLRRTEGIEVPDEALARSPRLNGLRARVAVLPAAVDPERFRPAAPAESSSKLREALHIPAEAPLIGIVARLKPERRHADLIAAFGEALPQMPQARLAIIGRGEGQAGLEALVGRLGLQQRVVFAGYWSGADLVEAYRGLDVAVWLANGNDGGARGVLEAMAIELPVVAYAVPPMAEQLADGAGVLVPPADTSTLAAQLAQLANDPKLCRAIGRRARKRVLARYTWKQRGPALLAFYASLGAGR